MYEIGGVLSQCHGKLKWNVSFASRVLTDAERGYGVIEKELLLCDWAVEHFQNYNWGSKFSLVGIISPRGGWNATARIARLVSRLQEYCFKVEYVTGKSNAVADCLLRLPQDDVKDDNVFQNELDNDIVSVVSGYMTNEFGCIEE
ncbi:hypothetical protein NDU88_004882 [Pleurodeles waltl]|uniref:Reverse transcriptase RNase H-like domain-containing protein n=1 Tax=Pleurodeles waltl TaxID=8319 RepID=A0AAV7RMQ6_PLEWA|nr:hypothetical protein NDU88_004882 [Pleurodeles waltl]